MLHIICIYIKTNFGSFQLHDFTEQTRLSWNIIRTSQRTFLNRYSKFCGSDSRGFAEYSSSTDNQQKLDSRVGITLVLDESAGFQCTPVQGKWDKEPTGSLLSPAAVGQAKVHCLS